MRKFSLALLPLALLASASAAQAPGFSATDKQLGAQEHPKLIAQFGGAYRGPQAEYVRTVGQRIAAQSGMATRPTDYTVTLLNSNDNNAFAIPGGYVYITRQLLALMNDEAELAFVMGHEVGHVAARHSQKRQQRSALSGLGAALLGAVTGSDIIGRVAGTGAQLYTLGFSRDQERQADSLGVRYLTSSGYDPMASGDILASLGAQTALEARLAGRSASAPATWLSTHPANGERVARIRKEASTFTARAGARATNRDRFLDAIDGMPYDDDPAEGVITGTSFRHPALAMAFEAPQGFALQNSPAAVMGNAGANGRFEFSGGKPDTADLTAYSAALWQKAGATGGTPRLTRINGIDAAISTTRANTKGGAVDATLAVYRWAPDAYYHILAIAPAGRDPGYDQLINSLRRLTPAEVRGIRGRRVQVLTVKRGDTVQSLAERMAYTDDRLARFTILNGIEANTRLVPGSRIKLIVQ